MQSLSGPLGGLGHKEGRGGVPDAQAMATSNVLRAAPHLYAFSKDVSARLLGWCFSQALRLSPSHLGTAPREGQEPVQYDSRKKSHSSRTDIPFHTTAHHSRPRRTRVCDAQASCAEESIGLK